MAVAGPKACRCREPFRGRSGVLFRKAGGRADARTRLYTKKGLRPRGLGLLHFFSPAPNRSPGASGPLGVWTSVQEISYPPIFTKRKSANFLGVRGNPGGVFASFCGYELKLGQKEVARRPNPFNKL